MSASTPAPGSVKRRAAPRPAPERGFSLIELLVALTIFALAAGLAYGGLSAIVRARGALATEGGSLARLQFAVALLERDLRQAVARPVRDLAGRQRPALLGALHGVELSTLHAASPELALRPVDLRTAWSVTRGALERVHQPALDVAPASVPARTTLLEAVEGLDLRYLGRDGEWRNQWPADGNDPAQADRLPRAVEFTLRVERVGAIRRIVPLPDPPDDALRPGAGPS